MILVRKRKPSSIVPIAGQRWGKRDDSPFPPPKNSTVTILDVKDNWVMYYESEAFPDSRMHLNPFVDNYKPFINKE